MVVAVLLLEVGKETLLRDLEDSLALPRGRVDSRVLLRQGKAGFHLDKEGYLQGKAGYQLDMEGKTLLAMSTHPPSNKIQ